VLKFLYSNRGWSTSLPRRELLGLAFTSSIGALRQKSYACNSAFWVQMGIIGELNLCFRKGKKSNLIFFNTQRIRILSLRTGNQLLIGKLKIDSSKFISCNGNCHRLFLVLSSSYLCSWILLVNIICSQQARETKKGSNDPKPANNCSTNQPYS
jgi:hypothetical protein